jgi:hypothetical protein
MMTETTTLLALFEEVEPAAEGIERLHGLGLADDQIHIISGVPVMERALGRPKQRSNIPLLALIGAVVGLLLGLFFSFGTPALFPVYVGGQPTLPVPPGIIVTTVLVLLSLLVFAFLGVFFESYLPAFGPLNYVPGISDGKIAVLFTCPAGERKKYVEALTASGAESVKPAEAQTP